MKTEKNFLMKMADKTAVEDYKSVKSEVDNFKCMNYPERKLAYQPVRIRNNRNR